MAITSQPTTARRSDTAVPIVDVLDRRWSPRSFDATAGPSDAQVTALLEAARWAPSASNHQPRRFVVARRGTATHRTVLENLMGFNLVWAPNAAVLVVAIAETATGDGEERPWAHYDLGQSVAAMTVQAHAEGLHVHQMGGIDVDGLRRAFCLAERFVPVTVVAFGVVADAGDLPDKLALREVQPRTRLPLDELVVVRD